ncbi:hypothetical protein ACPV40_14785 [Vibrio alfacsensis]|uniref:hypothetical protein n=1 Tax=Vibrio alfacsensis TaxID=1074311 RepID=UPI004068E648
MTEKKVRYLAWLLGAVIAIALCFLSEKSFVRYGLFSMNVKDTFVYEVLRSTLRSSGALTSTSREYAYFLWYVVLFGGVFFSWVIRFKVADFLKSIDKKV